VCTKRDKTTTRSATFILLLIMLHKEFLRVNEPREGFKFDFPIDDDFSKLKKSKKRNKKKKKKNCLNSYSVRVN